MKKLDLLSNFCHVMEPFFCSNPLSGMSQHSGYFALKYEFIKRFGPIDKFKHFGKISITDGGLIKPELYSFEYRLFDDKLTFEFCRNIPILVDGSLRCLVYNVDYPCYFYHAVIRNNRKEDYPDPSIGFYRQVHSGNRYVMFFYNFDEVTKETSKSITVVIENKLVTSINR